MIPTKQVSFVLNFDTLAARFLHSPFYFNLKLIINILNSRSQIQDLEALFSIYDVDNSGSIDYKEFASSLYGRPMTASSAGGGAARSPEELAEAMRQKLASRGARGFVGLQR